MGFLFNDINNYLNLSKSERLAVMFLLLVILLIVSMKHWFHLFYPDSKTDFSRFEKMIAEFELEKKRDTTSNIIKASFCDIDINDADLDEFVALKCKKKIAQRIINYRTRFGGFKSKDELYRIYGIDSLWLIEMWSYLILKNKKASVQTPRYNQQKSKKIELNSCDTNDLKQLKGIGSTLSKRIISYRNKLGGFYSIQQLTEVYGLKPETIERIVPFLILDTTKIVKININDAQNDSMYFHPYMGFKQFKTMKRYRQQHGNFKDENDLRMSKAFKIEELDKLLNYIHFGP